VNEDEGQRTGEDGNAEIFRVLGPVDPKVRQVEQASVPLLAHHGVDPARVAPTRKYPEWFGKAEKKVVKALERVAPENRVLLWLTLAYTMGMIDKEGNPVSKRAAKADAPSAAE